MVEHVRRHYPIVKILARAFDVNHLYLLKKAGVDLAVREMFDGSLKLGTEALRTLGMHPFKIEKMARAFRRHDQAGLDQLYDLWDENPAIACNRAFLARAREHGETLKAMMEADRLQLHDRTERGWTPPPKSYTKELAR
jgi:CPA2 family monovalent cation:H+ antiporter-2